MSAGIILAAAGMIDIMSKVSHDLNQPAIVDIFSSAMAREVTRLLATRGPENTAAIAESLGVPRITALRALTELESQGVVTGSPGVGHRAGLAVTWTYHAEAALNAVAQLSRYVTGESLSVQLSHSGS